MSLAGDLKEAWWPERGWINIGSISNHDFVDFGSGLGKTRLIARILHGETYPFLEFYCRQDLAAFFAALEETADTVLAPGEQLLLASVWSGSLLRPPVADRFAPTPTT